MNKIMGYNTGIVDEWGNVFELAMIVPGFAYYANYEESDENGNTVVVNDKNEILSNNIFANNDFMQTLEQVNAGKLQALYISDKMKENIDLLRESGYFDS
ncbi:hypothetical protein [Coprococcus sp. AM11-30B]|uniref:hypothetical protein n=1 Tax=Coprococcus sp. AM11-30B TaxID=2997950 RepID=UPI0022E709B2|nr:hypothetical protein [Coprococcus sp. AM11-30B]